jgi:uncharacterized membrane protein HdeD (DUF308 family)
MEMPDVRDARSQDPGRAVIRLLLLLLGTDWLRRHRRVLAGAGLIALAASVPLFVDALDDEVYFPLRLFGCLMLIEGFAMMAVAASGVPLRRNIQLARAGVVIVLGALVVFDYDISYLVLAVLFGAAFAVDGALRIATAAVVRFRGWPWAALGGACEIGVAWLIFTVYYASTIEFYIALALALSGLAMLHLAWRLRTLAPGASLAALHARGWPEFAELPPPRHGDAPPDNPLLVRVWTAAGTADHPVDRPIIDRYIAAEDAKGTISTGHSALEVAPDLYVSHYPAADIDHSPDDFIKLLRATADNDVEGTFQPSYDYESKQWCESTDEIAFERYDPVRLRAYWARYRQDATYNLTNRNCSSTVVHALETAIEGVLDRRNRDKGYLLRVFLSPELMVAAHLRKRAETMAWTPGLVLDYAEALRGALNPPRISWVTFTRLARATLARGLGASAESRRHVRSA